MGIFDFMKKKPCIKIEMRGYENGQPVQLKTTRTPNKTMPISYYQTIHDEILPLENHMVNCAVSLKGMRSVDDRISTLTELIRTFYELRDKCNHLGKEYAKYFSTTWEHMHNSQNPDFSYVTKYEKELSGVKQNRQTLHQQEQIYNAEIIGLEARIITLIQNNPGILQTDIYKEFNAVVRDDIQSTLYFLSKQNRILRQKYKNTYKIYPVK